jgi:hypothetical protein
MAIPSHPNRCIDKDKLMVDLDVVRKQIRGVMSRFVVVELEVGFAFARAAADARETRDILHNRNIARKAYDMAGKMMVRGHITEVDLCALKVQRLRLLSELRKLGDPCRLRKADSELPPAPVY